MSDDWWHRRLLLKVRSGSRAHGLETPDSDEDSRGICIPPKTVLLGLDSFEQWQSDDGDHVIYSLRKFARLALDGNPNIIETLYVAPQDRLFVHPLAEPMLAARDSFLSKRVGVKFGRYALHQLNRLERHYRWLTQAPPTMPDPEQFGAEMGENGPKFPDTGAQRAYKAAVKHHRAYREWRENRNPKRAALEEKYGYDTKHAMHLCRLLKMGIEILSRREVLVRRPDAEELKAIRSGGMSYEELIDWAQQREQELSRAEKDSALPDQPDQALAQKLVVEATERFLSLD